MTGVGEPVLRWDRDSSRALGAGACASRPIRSRARLPAMAALGCAILFLFTGNIHADEIGSSPLHAVDANHPVVASAPDANSNARNQATHFASFDDLPIRHHGDGAANGGATPGGSSNTPVSSTPSLEAPRVLFALARSLD